MSNSALAAAGAGAGALVVWGLQAVGADLDPGAGAIGGAVAAITIFTLKNGVAGLAELIWHGSGEEEQPPRKSA